MPVSKKRSAKAVEDTLALFQEDAEKTATDALSDLLDASDKVFVKRMSLNDWEWADKKNKHQNGPLIPAEYRANGFFPPMKDMERDPGEKFIRQVYFNILWQQTGEIVEARLVHYGSKDESHLTGVPKSLFTGLSPASFVLIGYSQTTKAADYPYRAVTIDSSSDEAARLIDLFELDPTFRAGIFEPREVVETYENRILEFAEQALEAYKKGTLSDFGKPYKEMPKPVAIALMAQEQFKKLRLDVADLNPYLLDNPGDCLMQISRGIEWEIYREHELRQRSLELVQLILGDDPTSATIDSAFRTIIREFRRIDKILLSASQTRKSKAGRSFEIHIESMLKDGGVPYEAQVVMKSKKRPDFVLPSSRVYKDSKRPYEQALVLSAKTTLRERWKQVESEIKNCDLYLATVDDSIAENTIEEMQAAGIILVVPESLKTSDTTVYKDQNNVVSFKNFFDKHIKQDRYPLWSVLGLVPSSKVDLLTV